MLVGSKTTSLLSRQEFQMQNTWELSWNRVLLAFIISILMPRLIARHVWEGCICNWALSQMFRWCLQSLQLHLWTRDMLVTMKHWAQSGFSTWDTLTVAILMVWCYLLSSFAQQGKRPFPCAVCFGAWDPLWQLANEWQAFCLTGIVKIAHAHLYYCLILLWVISDQY